MDNSGRVPAETVPSEAYTREYYQSHCQGYDLFKSTRGTVLPPRLSIPLTLSKLAPGMRVLDVGCGRGELLLHTREHRAVSYGLDYAKEAVLLARDTVKNATPVPSGVLWLQQANARRLPYASESFERVFLLDIVEHLYPEELDQMLAEVYRVLKHGGRAIIHTMPNLWYYRFGYPLYRVVQRLRGKKLPADPKKRWPYREVHVNEQTPLALGKSLQDAGFSARVRLIPAQDYGQESSKVMRTSMMLLSHLYPFRWVFCNDIFAVAIRPLRQHSKGETV